jgi:predicted transcriptional regulator
LVSLEKAWESGSPRFHLKELTRAGLISTRKAGQSTECWVAESTLDQFAQFFLKAKAPQASAQK